MYVYNVCTLNVHVYTTVSFLYVILITVRLIIDNNSMTHEYITMKVHILLGEQQSVRYNYSS